MAKLNRPTFLKLNDNAQSNTYFSTIIGHYVKCVFQLLRQGSVNHWRGGNQTNWKADVGSLICLGISRTQQFGRRNQFFSVHGERHLRKDITNMLSCKLDSGFAK